MKCKGLKLVRRLASGVRLYEERVYEIPFDVIYESEIVEAPPRPSGQIPHMRLKTKDGKYDGTAVVVYEELSQIVRFLSEEYAPGFSYVCDEILKSAANLRGAARVNYIIDASRRHIIQPYLQGRITDNREAQCLSSSEVGPKFAIAMSFFLEKGFKRFEVAGGSDFFCTIGRRAPHVFYYCGETVNIGGRAVERGSFLIMPPHAGQAIYWDGAGYTNIPIEYETVDNYLKLSDILPKKIYDKFDACGRPLPLRNSKYHILPPSDYEVKYLLKVPPASDGGYPLNADNAVLPASAGFVFDARLGLRLSETAEFIDDPAVAAAILARSPRGIYHPADHPNSATLNNYLEAETYYAALGGIK